MIQTLPQDLSLTQRISSALLQPIAEGAGQGFQQGAQNYQNQVQLPNELYGQQMRTQRNVSSELIPKLDSLFPDQNLSPYEKQLKNAAKFDLESGRQPNLGPLQESMARAGFLQGGGGFFDQGGSPGASQGQQASPMQQPQRGMQGMPPSSSPEQALQNILAMGVPGQAKETIPANQVQASTGEKGVGVIQPEKRSALNAEDLRKAMFIRPDLAEQYRKTQTLGQDLESEIRASDENLAQITEQNYQTALQTSPGLKKEVGEDLVADKLARNIVAGSPNDKQAIAKAEAETRAYNKEKQAIETLFNNNRLQMLTGQLDKDTLGELSRISKWYDSKGLGQEFDAYLLQKEVNPLVRSQIIYPLDRSVMDRIDKIKEPARGKAHTPGAKSKTVNSIASAFKAAPPGQNYMTMRYQMLRRGIPDADIREAYSKVKKDLNLSAQPRDVPIRMTQSLEQIIRENSTDNQATRTLFGYLRDLLSSTGGIDTIGRE